MKAGCPTQDSLTVMSGAAPAAKPVNHVLPASP